MDPATIKIPSLPTTSYMAVVVVFIFLATSAVLLRLYTKRKVHSTIAADDYLIICGLLCSWGLFITAIVAAADGGINYVKGDPLDAGILILKIFFAEPLLEFPGLSFIRISVLFFYKRIFYAKAWFRALCIAVSVIVALWGLAGSVVLLCSANPISRAWDPLSGNPYRIDFGRYAVTMNALGIALDVITLLLPLPIIYRLQMKLRNKFLTAGILWLGIFCIIADTIRLYYSVQEVTAASDASGTDRYIIPRHVSLWDRITPCASIIAACLPTYAPLLKGRNILESLVRTAGSWFSFGSGSKVSLERLGPSGPKHSDPWTRTESNEELRGWSRAQNEQGSNLAHITTDDIQLHDTIKPNAVNVTSTVNLNYSNVGAGGRV